LATQLGFGIKISKHPMKMVQLGRGRTGIQTVETPKIEKEGGGADRMRWN
jgi:hypothetical protein